MACYSISKHNERNGPIKCRDNGIREDRAVSCWIGAPILGAWPEASDWFGDVERARVEVIGLYKGACLSFCTRLLCFQLSVTYKTTIGVSSRTI